MAFICKNFYVKKELNFDYYLLDQDETKNYTLINNKTKSQIINKRTPFHDFLKTSSPINRERIHSMLYLHLYLYRYLDIYIYYTYLYIYIQIYIYSERVTESFWCLYIQLNNITCNCDCLRGAYSNCFLSMKNSPALCNLQTFRYYSCLIQKLKCLFVHC